MQNRELETYKNVAKERLEKGSPVIANTENGNAFEEVATSEGEIEFPDLYSGMKLMLKIIQEQVKELNELKQNLEKRVLERTEEISIKEKTLQENQQKLQDIIDSSTHLFYSYTTDYTLTYLSPRARDFFGLDPEEALKKWTDFIPDNPVNRNGLESTMKAIKAGKVQPPHELELFSKSGKKRIFQVNEAPVVKDGKTVAIAGALTEIYAYTDSDNALNKFASIVEYSTDAIISIDLDGIIESWNKGAEMIYQYHAKEILGKHVSILCPIHLMDEFHKNLHDAFKGEAVGNYETLNLKKGGEHQHVGLTISPIKNSEGRVTTVSIIARETSDSKRTGEESLKEKESDYQDIVENTADIVISIAPDGSILYINNAFTRVLGYNQEEIGTLSLLFNIIHPKFQPYCMGKFQMVLGGKEQEWIEADLISKNGELITVEGRVNCKSVNGKSHSVQCFLKDITLNKIQEKELNKETGYIKLLQSVAIASNEALSVEEAVKKSMDDICKLTGWSVGLFYNVSKDAVYKLKPTEIWYFDNPIKYRVLKAVTVGTDINSNAGLVGRVLVSGKMEWSLDILTENINVKRAKYFSDIEIKSGYAFPILINQEVAGVLEFYSTDAVIPDSKLMELLSSIGSQLGRVVERKRTQEQLKISEARMAEAQKIANVGDWEYDLVENSFYWSDEVYRIFGKTSYNFSPSYDLFISYIHPEDLDPFKLSIQTNDGTPYNINFRIVLADYSIKWVNSQGYTKFGITGEKIKYIGTIQDITKHKLAEEQLLKAKEFAEESVRTKEQFLTNMSHEIRTPMNGIMGFANLLESSNLTPTQKEYVQIIRNSGDHLLAIINDILDFSKIEAGKVFFEETKFKLAELIHSAMGITQVKVKEKGLKLIITIDDNIPDTLVGDRLRLNQILLNLISNSVKFTEKGEIEFNARQINEDAETISIEFKIRDTGIGIPEDKLSTIFESFSQVNNTVSRKYGGSGLGLSITKQLIDLQGGYIEVQSEVNKGTVFTFGLKFKKFSLQYSGEEIKPPLVEPPNTFTTNLEKVNILLVEDNPVNQYLALTVMNKWGCYTEVAENGNIAIEKLLKKDYDVVLMDLQMPEKDGYETTATIRNVLYKKMPIIAITAHAMKGESERCIQVGMNDYISKPFDPDVLYKTILKHLKKPLPVSNHSVLAYNPEKTLKGKVVSLQYLKDLSQKNNAFLIDMISIFNHVTPQVLKEMRSCVHNNNWKGLYPLAHKLKGSITTMGIKDYIEMIAKVERNALDQTNINDLPGLIEKIEKGCNQAMKELEEEKERLIKEQLN